MSDAGCTEFGVRKLRMPKSAEGGVAAMEGRAWEVRLSISGRSDAPKGLQRTIR